VAFYLNLTTSVLLSQEKVAISGSLLVSLGVVSNVFVSALVSLGVVSNVFVSALVSLGVVSDVFVSALIAARIISIE